MLKTIPTTFFIIHPHGLYAWLQSPNLVDGEAAGYAFKPCT